MKILFKKVTIRNFLSFGNIPTEFEYSTGINIVTGQNLDNGTRNGVGKSSLLVDSISFAIYGKTLRGEHVNRDEIVNEINKKNCEVTVEFYIGSDEYIVTRTIKPNSFTVFENGNEIKFDTMKNTERWLEEKIGISHTCFSNILVLNMNDTEPFLTMDASHKREVIEDVLNLNIFGRMSDIAKDRHLEAKNNVRTYENDVKSSSETLELAKNSRDNILREKEKFETEKNNKILLLENDIKKLISNKDSLESKIDTNDYVAILNDLSLKQDKVKEIIQSCKSRITELTNENIKIKDAVDSIENMPVCPKCHTPNPINNELVKNFIEGEKVKFDNNIKEISSKKEILEKSNIILKSLNDKIKENNENKTKQTDLNNELMIINNNLANKQKLLIEESMRVLTIENVISDDDIKKYSEKYDDVSKLYKDASKSFQFNSLLRKILGEEGIRKFVVSKVLPYFNSKINGYLKIYGI
jgi:DNA repair exonuclease SbcCD ATPase subunit